MNPADIETRLQQLLAADPVCQGRVSATTLRAIALEFAQEPAPDSDVLAERAACVGVMVVSGLRLTRAAEAEHSEILDLEARRLRVAIDTVQQGLHRPEKGS